LLALLRCFLYLLRQIFFNRDLGEPGEQSEEILWLQSYREFTLRE